MMSIPENNMPLSGRVISCSSMLSKASKGVTVIFTKKAKTVIVLNKGRIGQSFGLSGILLGVSEIIP